jgi:hypothetical protein
MLALAIFVGLAGFNQGEAQQIPPAAASYLGKWHQPAGPSGCGGQDAYEAIFQLTSFQNGAFAGTYSIACVNTAGAFKTDGTLPAARLNADGTLAIALTRATYVFNGQGTGRITIDRGTPFPLAMRKE